MFGKPIVVTFLLAPLLLILTGCGGSGSSPAPTVPASFTPLIGDYIASWSKDGVVGNSTFDVSIQSVQDPTGQSNSQVLALTTFGTVPSWWEQSTYYTNPASLELDSTGTKIVSAKLVLDEAAPSWGNPWVELNVSNSNVTGTMNDYAGGSTLAADQTPYQIALSKITPTVGQK